MINRRQFTAGAAALSVSIPTSSVFAQSATPAASPVATPMSSAPSSADVVPAWLDAQAALTELGRDAADAFWTLDTDAIIAVSSPEVAAALSGGFDVQELVDGYTLDQIHFSFPEAGAWFFGQFTPELLSGAFLQGGTTYWVAEPDEPQVENYPTGSWTGFIGPGQIDLGITLEFTGTGDALEVSLSIPAQMLMNAPMTDVMFHSELPIGEMSNERSSPAGGDVTDVNFYGQEYGWGQHTLVLQTVWSGKGQLAGLNLIPQAVLTEIPAHDPITARLPFDGAWLVFWGGETEFSNYHAVLPSQRYASDIFVWQDGATAIAPGTENKHYHTFGQPYLAPVSGTVVVSLDGMDDIIPQRPGNPADHIAGNHVVIETEGGFVFLAHCQKDSVLVQPGDIVAAGDVVALVGNSGNSSESHVHIHAQTSADIYDPEATGIPLIFENVYVNGEPTSESMPHHGTIMEQRS